MTGYSLPRGPVAGVALALAILSGAAPAVSQGTAAEVALPTPSADAPLRLMRADHIAIGVGDLDAMIAWYESKLDYVVERAWTLEGVDGFRFATLVGHGFRIEFIEGGEGARTPDIDDVTESLVLSGLQHMAFAVEDVDATLAVLERRGMPVFTAPRTSHDVNRRLAFVKDPEGNVIEFVASVRPERSAP